jgi:hypothetical protein
MRKAVFSGKELPMSLPGKSEKGYLEIAARGTGFAVTGLKQHLDDLAALFAQYGIPVQRQADVSPGEDALLLGADADLARAREVLEGYKTAKGS